jgi:hypothetical protein
MGKRFKKQQLAIDNGYKIVYIWESEMRNLSDEQLEKLLMQRLYEN